MVNKNVLEAHSIPRLPSWKGSSK